MYPLKLVVILMQLFFSFPVKVSLEAMILDGNETLTADVKCLWRNW